MLRKRAFKEREETKSSGAKNNDQASDDFFEFLGESEQLANRRLRVSETQSVTLRNTS